MRIPITATYTLGALAVAAFVLALSLWATRTFFERDFAAYVFEGERHQLVLLAAELASHYAEEGSWDYVRENPRRFFRLAGLARARHRADEHPGSVPDENSRAAKHHAPGSDNGPWRPPQSGRLILTDAKRKPLWGRELRNPNATGPQIEQPIIVAGATVGYLQNRSVQRISRDVDLAFSSSQRRTVIVVGITGLALASLFAFLLARRMVAPIKQIQAHTREMQKASFTRTLEVRRNDELGDLAASLNELSATLQANRSARQQWLANISHELRTPLAVVKAEIEALQDNVRPLTQEAIASLAREIDHLQYLINDLNELTLSDLGALNYEKQALNLGSLIADIIESQRTRINSAHARVTFQDSTEPAMMLGDPHRLRQLFSNLLDNALKYSDEPATVEITCTVHRDKLSCTLRDSPPGIREVELEEIFAPLFRGDRARTGRSSGLGLAICRNLVTAHHGSISAEASPLGGLQVNLEFPRLPTR